MQSTGRCRRSYGLWLSTRNPMALRIARIAPTVMVAGVHWQSSALLSAWQNQKEKRMMISRRSLALSLAVAVLSAPALAASRGTSALKLLDPDNDGTVDVRELRGRLTAKELAAADPDHDGTLTLDEYLAVVEQRFKAADPDNDGTLDAKELKSRAGRALLRLLK